MAFSARTKGMSSPSSHIIGSSVSLPWSCQAQLGVVTKSPGRISVFSPETVVYAPLPSTITRSAEGHVAEGGRDLAGHHELDTAEERLRYARPPAEARIQVHEHAAL